MDERKELYDEMREEIDEFERYYGIDQSEIGSLCSDLSSLAFTDINIDPEFFEIVKNRIKRYLAYYKENYKIVEIEENKTFKIKMLQRK